MTDVDDDGWRARPEEVCWSDLLNDPGQRCSYADLPRWVGVDCDEDYPRRVEPAAPPAAGVDPAAGGA